MKAFNNATRMLVILVALFFSQLPAYANNLNNPSAHVLLPIEAKEPDEVAWKALSRFNGVLTRREFERKLSNIFAPFGGIESYIKVDDQGVDIFAKPHTSTSAESPQPVVRVLFAPSEKKRSLPPSPSRTVAQFKALPKTDASKPLQGLRIAIDPADIGGQWAKLEDRSVYYRGYGLIQEGELNLKVGLLVRDRLQQLGATVAMTRTEPEPVNTKRTADYLEMASEMIAASGGGLPSAYKFRAGQLRKDSPRRVEIAAEVLFIKTFETRYRAHRISEQFHPDVTLVLQHNATASSTHGGFASMNRNTFFVHGAYMASELKDARQRWQMLSKVFDRVLETEITVADAISQKFKNATGFAPVLYGDSATTRAVIPSNPYVVARNIGVNREYMGPIVVAEPYFMNERTTMKRLLAGDFEGTRTLGGVERISIFREYANAIVDGVLQAYAPQFLESSKTQVISK